MESFVENQGRDSMKHDDLFSGLFLLILSAGVCLMAYRLGLGSISIPQAGLIPFLTAALLGLMSLGLCLKNFFKVPQGHHERQVFRGIMWARVGTVLLGLLGYGLAFNSLGFHICTFILMMLLLNMVNRRKWWRSVTISFLTVFFTYLIFELWLDCQFPRGPFGI